MDKKKLKETIEQKWPETKKRIEQGIKEAKRLMEAGEKQLVQATDKGVRQVQSLTMHMKKERLYHTLGKTLVETPQDQWPGNDRIAKLIKDIRTYEKQAKDILKDTPKAGRRSK